MAAGLLVPRVQGLTVSEHVGVVMCMQTGKLNPGCRRAVLHRGLGLRVYSVSFIVISLSLSPVSLPSLCL